MTDLRPCPFCGGKVNMTYYSADNVFSVWHEYDGCKFIEPMYIDGEYAKSLADARNIWNERPDQYLTKEQETVDTGSCRVFQCKRCGYGIDDIFVNDEEKYQIVPRYCPNCGRKVSVNE